MSYHPIDDAYADAIHLACPNCHALPGEFCMNRQSGKPSRIPCVARLKEADAERPQLPLHPEEVP